MSDDNDKKKISRFHYTYIQANGAPAALIKENSSHFPLRPYASAQVKKKMDLITKCVGSGKNRKRYFIKKLCNIIFYQNIHNDKLGERRRSKSFSKLCGSKCLRVFFKKSHITSSRTPQCLNINLLTYCHNRKIKSCKDWDKDLGARMTQILYVCRPEKYTHPQPLLIFASFICCYITHTHTHTHNLYAKIYITRY